MSRFDELSALPVARRRGPARRPAAAVLVGLAGGRNRWAYPHPLHRIVFPGLARVTIGAPHRAHAAEDTATLITHIPLQR
jgi:hypothetical protein